MKTDNTELYASMPIKKAVILLALPTVISQLITVVYNIADTFFIGQLNDPNQVAAVTLSMPTFIFMTGIANLFGIGGASVISRCLGRGDKEKAKKCSVFSIYGCVFVALLYGLIMFAFRSKILPFLGADSETYDFCKSYTFWTITIGSVPTVLTACLAHLVRSEGYSSVASIGLVAGGILNIILDPIFIAVLNLKIQGAALATLFSNVFSVFYFIIFIFKIRKNTVLTAQPKLFTLKHKIPIEIITVGLPSFIMNAMGLVSNVALNKLVAGYSNQAVAGMGVAKKVDMLAFALANGMTQGVLSLIGYNYASGDKERMNQAIKTAFLYCIIISTIGAVLLFVLATPVSKMFIDDKLTVEYAKHFLKVLCVTCPTISATFMVITVFQATGKRLQPMILSFLRKGGFDVPLMFILNNFGVKAIAYATPISDVLALILALSLFLPYVKKLNKNYGD